METKLITEYQRLLVAPILRKALEESKNRVKALQENDAAPGFNNQHTRLLCHYCDKSEAIKQVLELLIDVSE